MTRTPRVTSRQAPRRAFTLVELIAVMIVVAVIGAVGAMTMQRAAAANSQVSTRSALYGEASAAMDRLIRKVQSTPARAASNPTVPSIASFTATTFTFDDLSTVTYDANAQTIVLRDVAAGDTTSATPVLLGQVTAFTATPFDQSNANIFTALGVASLNSTQSATIRRISIQFTMTREGQSVTLRSRAFIRCTMASTG
ncbi:MAG: prepilin-type N-terminal cleavage/methylation domain-containing protein [Phycisphaerales bacterium]|nr:prepilin-type N-terminal cleavage/methylation domain-containing protein [Phycisphaerales bacterium]